MTGSALRQRLAVNTSSPSAARRLLREWLAALRWPVEGIDDLVLAANEAVSDAVQHHYPDGSSRVAIRFDADVAIRMDETSQVVITVVDGGRWQPPPASSGFRGRGMFVMRAVCESVQFHATDTGTHVVLISYPVPARSSTPLPEPRPPAPGLESPPPR
jgi:anti-sigma regulatory factor (Ser/Thr protein kinase)